MITNIKSFQRIENKKNILFLFLVVLYIITAFNSSGYHHQDEHFQIIQFAEYKVGNINEVSWEHKERVRSSLQPLICILIFNAARAVGISDHFHLALILRLITGLIGALSIMFYLKTQEEHLSQKSTSLLSVLFIGIWFLPYINTRFSSEAYSGFAMLWVFSFINISSHSKTKISYVLIGIFMGLSILFRFQSMFFILGLLGWYIFIKKELGYCFLLVITSLFLVLIFGVLIDSYYYGSLTFSILNYFRIHALGNLSILFGTSPWYEIFDYIIVSPSIFVGIIIAFSFLLLFTDYKNKLLWGIVPFLVVHALSPHKELRFFFPLVNFVPIIITLAVERVDKGLKIPTYLKYIIGSVFIITNIAGLYVVLFRTTRGGEIEVAQKISQYPRAHLITANDANPFEPRIKFKNYFYRPNEVKITEVSSLWDDELNNKLILKGYKNFIVIRKRDFVTPETDEIARKLKMKRSVIVSDSIMTCILHWYDREINDDELILYEQQ